MKPPATGASWVRQSGIPIVVQEAWRVGRRIAEGAVIRRARRLVLAGAAAAGLGTAACAGTAPTLLCQREEVLRIVDRTVRGWNVYNRMVDGTALETPTGAANAVICHATMTGVGYEATAEGWVARPHQELRRYDVQVVGNRVFVQVPR